jgi:hypothetical protein
VCVCIWCIYTQPRNCPDWTDRLLNRFDALLKAQAEGKPGFAPRHKVFIGLEGGDKGPFDPDASPVDRTLEEPACRYDPAGALKERDAERVQLEGMGRASQAQASGLV